MNNVIKAPITATLILFCLASKGQTIWDGPELTFTKSSNADWTLAVNQDKITDEVIFTRQNKGQLYNYAYWQSTFATDAVMGDICRDFHNLECFNEASVQTFTSTGGTNGVKWAILDNTSATTDWTGFNLYGTLGNPTNFYSFNNLIDIISKLEEGTIVTSVDDNFNTSPVGSGSGINFPDIVGKKLGAWIVDEDIYLTFTFTDWGKGNSGGSVSYKRSTSLVTSLNDLSSNDAVNIYPNPSQNFIHINTQQAIQHVELVDMTGNSIALNDQSTDAIDISHLEKGSYLLKITTNDKVVVKRFVKN